MLTRKQHELLMFIHERIKETGVSPSFDEMKEALDLASKSGIHRLITALEERGFLRRLPHRARALEVVKLPQQATMAAPPKGRAPFQPKVVDGGPVTPAAANDVRDLPVLGRIAAGTPIEAIQQERDRIPAAQQMSSKLDNAGKRIDDAVRKGTIASATLARPGAYARFRDATAAAREGRALGKSANDVDGTANKRARGQESLDKLDAALTAASIIVFGE